MATEPAFEPVVTADTDIGETLVVGTADVAVAGLTAVDYLTAQDGVEQIGHVRTHGLPDITPFRGGEPRYPIRLYHHEEAEATVLLSEVMLPVWVADGFAEAIFEWLSGSSVERVLALFGSGFAHSETDHEAFYVGTGAFREDAEAVGLKPLAGGFFDGVVGELVTRGMAVETPAVGVLVTPAHPPGPDLDGALRLLEGYERVANVSVDDTELRARSEEMKAYYQQLADRMQTLQDGDGMGSRDYPEDRMYM